MKPLISVLVLLATACQGGTAAHTPDGGRPVDAAGPSVDSGGGKPDNCVLAACQDGIARTCDPQPTTLDCRPFGGACAMFEDASNTPFSWCNCGTIAEGAGVCSDPFNGVSCSDGFATPVTCPTGTACEIAAGTQFGLDCACGNAADGICPDPACTDDPDCKTCAPKCDGKQCGDNGCQGNCGSCAFGDTCSATGQCEHICVPQCDGKQCGDDKCDGSCGACDGTCGADGQCAGACMPSCTGKTCGSDGCTGSCGTCTGGLVCNSGTCGCDFFATVTYTFEMPPLASLASPDDRIAINVHHINTDGTQTSGGAILGYGTNFQPTYSYRALGCMPDIEIERTYTANFHTCTATSTVTGRTDFMFAPAVLNSDGTCTAPPL